MTEEQFNYYQNNPGTIIDITHIANNEDEKRSLMRQRLQNRLEFEGKLDEIFEDLIDLFKKPNFYVTPTSDFIFNMSYRTIEGEPYDLARIKYIVSRGIHFILLEPTMEDSKKYYGAII